MASAEEKEAKQATRDVARASIVQGQQRLASVGKAGSAYPTRRLRSSGDLSRYAIGGFLSDALPPITPGKTAPKPVKATTKTGGTAKPPVKAKPVVRATLGRGVRTSGLVGATEAAYINRSVGIRPTTGR